MDFAFRDLFEKKNFEALDTCVFVVISTAIRQLPINIFILGSVGHLVFTVYIFKPEYTSTLGPGLSFLDIRLLVIGYWISFRVFFCSGFCGFYGSGYRYRWLHCGEPPPFPFRRDQGKLSKLIFSCKPGYTYHLIGCNSMPPCFHFLFEGSTENDN